MKLFLCVAALLLSPAAAFTQGNPGPFGGLFGRTPQRTGVDYRVFEIRGSTGAQFNDALFEEATDRRDPPFTGVVGNTGAAAAYERRSDRLTLQLGSIVEHQHSLTSQRTRATTLDGGAIVSGRLTTRVSAEITANYRQSPYFQFYPRFAWSDDGLAAPGLPYEATALRYHVGEARVGVAYQYSKSSTLSARTVRSDTWFPSSPNSRVTLSRYEGLWSRRLNRDFGIRLGYGRQDVRHQRAAVGNYIDQHIEAGVDFNRALTILPRTTLAFTTYSSILRQPDRTTRYRLNGEFLLTRRFQRTWKLEFNGKRSTDFMAGFVDPLLADSLSLAISGLIAKRVELGTMIEGRRGSFGFDGELGRFTMAGSIAKVNIAITRHVGIYSRYGFYHHEAPVHTSSLATIGTLSRQSITAGISAWLPVFVRERTPLDSR